MTLNIPNNGDQKRVVVVGGGFAGLAFVKGLSRAGYQVVLIDRNNYHLFQPLLYQVATATLSPGDIAFPFRKLFRGKRNVYFRMAEVEGVDTAKKIISTDKGTLCYDRLVLATGCSTNFFGMDAVEERALPMKEASEALAIRNQVFCNIEKALTLGNTQERESLLNIVIVGGGASGVELAGAFSEMKRYIAPKDYPEIERNDINIYLLEGSGKLMASMSEKTSEDTALLLKKMGVKVLLNSIVTNYVGHRVELRNGGSIATHNLIWTSGVEVLLPDGMEKSQRGRAGRVVTDLTFRVEGYDNIYAIGDASIQIGDEHPNGYPQLARVAIEQAQHLAKNFHLEAKNKDPKPYEYTIYPVMATVGRNKAFAEFRGVRVKGFFAWATWAVIHLFSVLGVKNKVNVLWGWFWNYVTFDLPSRVVITPRKRKNRGKQTQ